MGEEGQAAALRLALSGPLPPSYAPFEGGVFISRIRAEGEHLEKSSEILLESQGQNVALTV